jgi:hypothetical protein
MIGDDSPSPGPDGRDILLNDAERTDFRFRAQESAVAPDCSEIVSAFLLDARNLMRTHPHDAEIAIVVAREALRLRNDDFAWEATEVLEDPWAPWDVCSLDWISLLNLPAPDSIDGARWRLAQAGFEDHFYPDDGAKSRFRAGVFDAAWLLRDSGWAHDIESHRTLVQLASETATELESTLSAARSWLGESSFDRTVARVLHILKPDPLHDVMIESLVARTVAARGSAPFAPLSESDLELAGRCNGRHSRARCLASLATRSTVADAESLRRAVRVARELRGPDILGDYWYDTEASRIQKDVELCAALAKAYVRVRAPIFPPVPTSPFQFPPDPQSSQEKSRPRVRSVKELGVDLQLLLSETYGTKDPVLGDTRPSEIEPFHDLWTHIFPEEEARRAFWRVIEKALADERKKVAQGLSTPPHGISSIAGGPTAVEAVEGPCSHSGDPRLADAEAAIRGGKLDAARDILKLALEAVAAHPPNDNSRRELRCIFGLAIRADDLALAEVILDRCFETTPRPDKAESRSKFVSDEVESKLQRTSAGPFAAKQYRPAMNIHSKSSSHQLDDLVATLADHLARRGDSQGAVCALRKYMDLGASARSLAGFARGRLMFAQRIIPDARSLLPPPLPSDGSR